MPKTPLHYPVQKSLKMSENTFSQLLVASDREGVKYGTLLRRIVEEWLVENL